ncbi:MAG: hypothetical protein ACM3QR_00485 [Syntrophothermus sp.]
MYKSLKIVGLLVATTGLAYALKEIMHKKERHSGWHKIKVEEGKKTGTRYGSNPIRY